MVILTRSFRAVFRKESWMFCAGLLLSIADLLELNCQLPTAGPGRFEPAPNHSRFPSLPALKEQGGTTRSEAVISLPPARCEYHTANRVAFQYSSYLLSYSRLTGSRAEVQTCLDSRDEALFPA